ncbi:hypothetical protein CFT13S00388_07895 [Campylobacter fetus subsp. testudinum]|uniref:hypothetical protein n=1 Tax=Campylobacter fetus TaxID=196 RepID=UPI000818757D|nr:hypothetical protein [Campylobacter fetus]OCR86672.1 hypothetical protein CFT13S00388_07895 [Campylobacter fetus subsp. testudinum]
MSYTILTPENYQIGDGARCETEYELDILALQNDFNEEMLYRFWQDGYTIHNVVEGLQVFQNRKTLKYKALSQTLQEFYYLDDEASEVYYDLMINEDVGFAYEKDIIRELLKSFIDSFLKGELNHLSSYKKLERNDFESLARYA